MMNDSHKWARLFFQIGLNRTFLKQSSILWGCPTKVGNIAKLRTPFFSDFLTGFVVRCITPEMFEILHACR